MTNKDVSGDERQRLLDQLHDWTARADAEWDAYWAAHMRLDRELDALTLRGQELCIPVAELAEALSSKEARWTPDGVTARIRKINERERWDRDAIDRDARIRELQRTGVSEAEAHDVWRREHWAREQEDAPGPDERGTARRRN